MDAILSMTVSEAAQQSKTAWEALLATLSQEAPAKEKLEQEAEELDNKLTAVMMTLSLPKAKPTPEDVDNLVKLVTTILANDKLVIAIPKLFGVNSGALAIFSKLDALTGLSNELFESVVARTVSLVQSLSTVVFSKGDSMDDEEEEESKSGDGPEPAAGLHPTDDQQLADTWSACSDVLLQATNKEKRGLLGKYGPAIVTALVEMTIKCKDPNLFLEECEVLSQLLLLTFTGQQVKDWEAIEPHDIEDVLEGEEEMPEDPGKMIGDVEADPHYYDGFPFFTAELTSANVAKLIDVSLGFHNILGSIGASIASVIAAFVLCLQKFPAEETNPLIKNILDKLVALLTETNNSDTLLAKIPLFNTLGHVFEFATVENLKPHWTHLFNMVENCRATEQAKLKPKAAPKRGRGRGGRGRGGGGQRQEEPDPEKVFEFKLLSKTLAFVLGRLVGKGEELLLENANKFFQVTESAFKSRELLFDYIIALKAYCSKPEADAQPNVAAVRTLLQNKLTNHFKADHDNLSDRYSSPESKRKSILRLTQMAISKSRPGNESLFPEYLEKIVSALVHVIANDIAKVGPCAIVCFEKIACANVSSEFIQSKVPEFVTALVPLLSWEAKEDEVPEESEEEEPIEELLKLAAVDALEILLALKEFEGPCKNAMDHLIPVITKIVVDSAKEVKEIDDLTAELQQMQMKSNAARAAQAEADDEPPGLVPIDKAPAAAPAAAGATPAFNFGAAPAGGAPKTGTSLGSFNFGAPAPAATPGTGAPAATPAFNFGAAPAGVALPSFNFGGDAAALPKFDFGAPAAGGVTAPTSFNFAPVAGAGGIAFPKFDFAAAAADAGSAPGAGEPGRGRGRGGRGRGGRGRGGKHAHHDCSSEEESSSEEDVPRGRGRGGRGRGRGRGVVVESESSEEESFDDEFEFGDSEEEEDEDEDSPEATLCLASIDVAILFLKLASPEQKVKLAELVDQSQKALAVLDECTDLQLEVRDRKQRLQAQLDNK